jgi:hypothetical protein
MKNNLNYQKDFCKVLNAVNGQLFIGATCAQLSKRMAHMRKQAQTGTDPLFKRVRAIGPDNLYTELVEEFPFAYREQLVAREIVLLIELGTTLHFFGKQARRCATNTQTQAFTPEVFDILQRRTTYKVSFFWGKGPFGS